jgi:hypothetical protein
VATVNAKTKAITTAESETFRKGFDLSDIADRWGVAFAANDYVKVAITNKGKPVYEKIFPIAENRFVFRMDYADARKIRRGEYSWDFGFIFGGVLDDSGKLISCQDFIHPFLTAEYIVKGAAAK